MDYIGVSTILSFAACETKQCLNITIVSDLVDEPVEEFDVILERTIGLDTRISLDPVDARTIIDNDGKLEVKPNVHQKFVNVLKLHLFVLF